MERREIIAKRKEVSEKIRNLKLELKNLKSEKKELRKILIETREKKKIVDIKPEEAKNGQGTVTADAVIREGTPDTAVGDGQV